MNEERLVGKRVLFVSVCFLLFPPLIYFRVCVYFRAPNFAYGLTARKFLSVPKGKRPILDLSSVRHMINAAEPVSLLCLLVFSSSFLCCSLNVVFFFGILSRKSTPSKPLLFVSFSSGAAE